MGPAGEIQVVDVNGGPPLRIVRQGGDANAVVWPGMGARLRSIHVIELGPRGETIQLRHPGEAVYCVTAGAGLALDADSGVAHELRQGSMAHVEAGTAYVLSAGQEGLSLVGGPAPADPALYEHLR